MAIVVDGRVVSSPIIQGALRRSMVLTGIGNLAEVEELAASINQQAADAPVDPSVVLVAAGDDGWSTATLSDIDSSPPGSLRLLDFDGGRLAGLPGEDVMADADKFFRYLKEQGFDAVVEVFDNETLLISQIDAGEEMVQTSVGDLPFATQVETAEGATVDVVVESIDAEAKSITLRYRLPVNPPVDDNGAGSFGPLRGE